MLTEALHGQYEQDHAEGNDVSPSFEQRQSKLSLSDKWIKDPQGPLPDSGKRQSPQDDDCRWQTRAGFALFGELQGVESGLQAASGVMPSGGWPR